MYKSYNNIHSQILCATPALCSQAVLVARSPLFATRPPSPIRGYSTSWTTQTAYCVACSCAPYALFSASVAPTPDKPGYFFTGQLWLEIEISKIIPAQKWRIIRLLTKVWDFPASLPYIKEVLVIEKSRNRMKTKWQIKVDNIPVSWIEEEMLGLKQKYKSAVNLKVAGYIYKPFGTSEFLEIIKKNLNE